MFMRAPFSARFFIYFMGRPTIGVQAFLSVCRGVSRANVSCRLARLFAPVGSIRTH